MANRTWIAPTLLLALAVALLGFGLFQCKKAREASVGVPRRYATFVPEYEFPFTLIYSYTAATAVLGLALVLAILAVVLVAKGRVRPKPAAEESGRLDHVYSGEHD